MHDFNLMAVQELCDLPHQRKVEFVATLESMNVNVGVVNPIELIRPRLEEGEVLLEASRIKAVGEVDHLGLCAGSPQRRNEKESAPAPAVCGAHAGDRTPSAPASTYLLATAVGA